MEWKSRSRFPIFGWLLGALLLPGAASVAQAPPPPNSPQRDTEVIERLEEEYLRAEIEDDATIAGATLADDYVGLRPDGSTSTKADLLSRLNQHQRRKQPYMVSATNMRVHLFGDTACVNLTKVYSRPGNQGTFSENVLHVLLRKNGIWRIQLSTVLPSVRN